jgi:uncharacterized membrane protein YidH (DUF202 family)
MQLSPIQKLIIYIVGCCASLYFLVTAFIAFKSKELKIRGELYQASSDPMSYWFFMLIHLIIGGWILYLLFLSEDE